MSSYDDRRDRHRSSDRDDRRGSRRHSGRHSRSRSRSRHRSRSPHNGRERNHGHRHGSPDVRDLRRSGDRDRHRDERHYDDRWHEDRQRFDDRRPDDRMRRSEGAVLATEPPAIGSILRGTVTSIRPFGVFVRPQGHPQDAMVYSGQVSEQLSLSREDPDEDKVKALEYFAPRHTQVWIKILEVTDDGSRTKIGASMKVVDQDTGRDLDPDNLAAARPARMQRGPESDEPPQVGTIHQATVERVQAYGIFVRLKGYRKFGLVHSSQVSDHLELSREDSDEDKIAALSSVVAVGEQVLVKVVDVQQDERGPKVGCSIKLVNQRDGSDLDPNFVKYRPRREDGGGGRQGPLGSAAGQVVSGARIDWGHLTGGDTQYGNASNYDLVNDEAGEPVAPPPQMPGHGGPPQRGAVSHPGPPMGRGRQMVQPAWMTAGTAEPAAPGKPPEWGNISSVEEALQILEKAGKKEKKEKKKKKDKKEKDKDKKHKDKSDKKKRK